MNASTEAEKRQQAWDLSGTLRAHWEEILKRARSSAGRTPGHKR